MMEIPFISCCFFFSVHLFRSFSLSLARSPASLYVYLSLLFIYLFHTHDCNAVRELETKYVILLCTMLRTTVHSTQHMHSPESDRFLPIRTSNNNKSLGCH